MNLHCFFYTPVKTRSLYRSSLECSNGSKSTYSTQLTKIVQLQRLIAPKPMGVSPPQMLPKRSSNASALVQSKSQVRRPLRYGATGVQSHPILVTVTAFRLWPTSAPKRRPAIDPKRAFTTLFHSKSRNTAAVLSSGSPWMKESPVKTATRHSLFHAHITSLFLEWKSADISVLHLLSVDPGLGTDLQQVGFAGPSERLGTRLSMRRGAGGFAGILSMAEATAKLWALADQRSPRILL